MPRKLLLLLLSGFILALHARAQYGAEYHLTSEINSLLSELDSILTQSSAINEAKEERISMKRSTYQKAKDIERRYWIAAELYDEYSAFDSDSAMAYAERARELAARMNRRELVDDMNLNRAYIFSATGMLDEAHQCLQNIDETELSTDMLWKYCDRLLFLDTHRNQYKYMGEAELDGSYPPVIDSLLQTTIAQITPDSQHYCWLVGWGHLKDETEATTVIPLIKPVVDASAMTSRDDAMNAWVLSKLYEYMGDYTNKLKYLIKSAIADVKASNKEIASIEEVADILFNLGDLERSSTYVNYSIACANEYKSRVRLGRLAMLQERTLSAIHERSVRQDSKNRRYLYGLIAILIILVFALVFIIMQMRQLRRSRANIGRMNKELQDHIEELKQTREELRQANSRLSDMYDDARRSASELSEVNDSNEQYIASIFNICSDYISKLDEFRKNIYRMIVARRYDEIRELTKSQELSHGELKELYSNFDKIFLSIYPNFVEDFNQLLRPEERIVLRNDDKLTTELRIYALVRLGLNDSVKIARFLHCSVQTVYNTRQRTRNKAIIPRDSFADAVKRLGKPSF